MLVTAAIAAFVVPRPSDLIVVPDGVAGRRTVPQVQSAAASAIDRGSGGARRARGPVRRDATARLPRPHPLESSRLLMSTPLDVGGPIVAKAVPPTRIELGAEDATAARGGVEITAASGRAVVLRPSNANITIVWFY
ncbi:MAG: hypothetical protein K2X99_08215 [Gemmatimonadaceae bacterium]|nr:hypothetical protein [Gemmatimonadaceae bacterium]